MFVRTKTTEGRTYLQVVESYWQDGRPRQRVIATLGRLDKLSEKGQIEGILRSLARFSDKIKLTEQYQAGKLKAQRVRRVGPDLLVGRLWSELGIDQEIESLLEERKYGFSVERAIYLATLSRLFFPGSDRRAQRIARDYRISGVAGLELHHLYRAMAWLGENREKIEELLFLRHRNLFSSLSMVFFDTTTLYFEGRGGQSLGRRGYSRDRRPDEAQMVVGVVMDDEGRPISCPCWPGDTADAQTIVRVASSLRDRFGVGEVTVVADRGMVGAKNMATLTELGFPYILGVKMRLEKKAMGEVLFQAGPFRQVEQNLQVKEVIHKGQRYIVCFNPEEAEHDRLARETMVEDLKRKLKRGASSLIGNSGFRRYLKMGQKPEIDFKKVAQEERYDGKWVLITTSDLPAEEVALRYKELWRVERIFREAKNTLETRPIYHKYDSTILGHVFVSFLALLIMQELKTRIDFPCEWEEIRQDLDALYEVEVKQNGRTWILRNPLQGVAGKVLRACGVAIPPSAVEASS